MGDLNINLTTPSTPRTILINSLKSCGLTPLYFLLTFHRGLSKRTIDYICVSDLAPVTNYEQFNVPGISEQDCILATLCFVIESAPRGEITRRSYKKYIVSDFGKEVAAVNWDSLDQLDHIDDKVQFFTDNVTKILDKHAPYRTFTPKKRPSPWLTSEIRDLIKKRNKMWHSYKSNRLPSSLEAYKKIRNAVKTKTRNAASVYYKNKITACRGSRELWKCVEELGLLRKSRNNAQLPSNVDAFNAHFIGNTTSQHLEYQRRTVRIAPDNRFYFQHVEVKDLVDAVLTPQSSACGPDGISIKILRDCLPHILTVLLHIFDCSLQTGVFPSQWKAAHVRPIPKRSNPTEIAHFRPISLLSTVSKVLERVALKQISDYISSNDLLDPYQSGFRRHFSTHTALINLTDNIREAIDKEWVTLLVAVDYTRAFDMVNISLLIDKLKVLGFSDSACNWVQSFLSDRSQVVVSGTGEHSAPLERNLGVPQGSTMGPPFFSFFINDAPSCLMFCKYQLYADDKTIYLSGPINKIHEIIDKVNTDLANLVKWSKDNGLLINASKTQAIWFGSRNFIRRIDNTILPPVVIDGSPIEICDNVKILGVTLDSTLSYSEHCTNISNKCYGSLASLRRCQEYIPPSTEILLIKTLVFPHLDYCCGLFLGLSSELIAKLTRCKNAALRFATGIKKWEHISPAYISHEILQFTARRNFLCLSLLVAVLNGRAPSYLTDKFKFLSLDGPGSKRRSELDLFIPWARTCYFQKSFCLEVAQLWNQLPHSIRSLYRLPCFKLGLHEFFLRAAAENGT